MCSSPKLRTNTERRQPPSASDCLASCHSRTQKFWNTCVSDSLNWELPFTCNDQSAANGSNLEEGRWLSEAMLDSQLQMRTATPEDPSKPPSLCPPPVQKCPRCISGLDTTNSANSSLPQPRYSGAFIFTLQTNSKDCAPKSPVTGSCQCVSCVVTFKRLASSTSVWKSSFSRLES